MMGRTNRNSSTTTWSSDDAGFIVQDPVRLGMKLCVVHDHRYAIRRSPIDRYRIRLDIISMSFDCWIHMDFPVFCFQSEIYVISQ